MVDITLHIAIDELCQHDSIDKEAIVELVDYGIASPQGGATLSEWFFDLETAYWIKKAITLNQQLLLDWVAISMLIDLMKEKERLTQENAQLKMSLNRLL